MPADSAESPGTSKGQRTRAEIVRRSACLMNREGFLAAPMSHVIAATGIQKGGLYRHFESREALAFEAFDHAVAAVRDRFLAAMAGHEHACDRLLAMLSAYEIEGDPHALGVPFEGGCPIMNAGIEADHAHPQLRERARAAMRAWHALVARIVAEGMRRGEIRADADPDAQASLFIACVEGAVMLSHLNGDAAPLRAARLHLERYIQRDLRVEASS